MLGIVESGAWYEQKSQGAGSPKFRLPKLEARTKYRAGQVISFIVCMVLLNFFYNHLLPASQIIVLPLTVYFIWTISKKELDTF